MLLENQCQEDNFRFLKLKNLLFTVEIKGRELRKIILRTYENKDELKNEINKSFAKYISEFDIIPESLKDKRVEEVDRTPAENLAYHDASKLFHLILVKD